MFSPRGEVAGGHFLCKTCFGDRFLRCHDVPCVSGFLRISGMLQDTIEGTFTRSYDGVLAWLEWLDADNILKLTNKGIACWGTVPAGGLVHAPQRCIVVHVMVVAGTILEQKTSDCRARSQQSRKHRCAHVLRRCLLQRDVHRVRSMFRTAVK